MDLTKRIDELDYLRGFALLGIILVNIVSLLSAKAPIPGTLDAFYWKFLCLFIEGRFYPIFTFLFGVGCYIFLSRAHQKRKNGKALFVRRILVLVLIGIIHVQFHPGEALTVYAVSGLIILPFYQAPKWLNLGFGLVLLVVMSLFSMKLLMVIPIMLLGVAVGQFHVFHRVEDHIHGIAVFTAIVFVLSIIGLSFQYQYVQSVPGSFVQRFLSIGIAIGPVVSAFYMGTVVLLLRVPLFQTILSPLKSYGKMALTNYVMQTVFIRLAGDTFELEGQVTMFQTFYFCLAICIVQLLFSRIWLRIFRFGPLEWLWRFFTYLEVPPMHR